MIIQQILLFALFLAAVVYLGSVVYKSFQARSGCGSGCGKCTAVDFEKIEKQLREKQTLANKQ
jgi:bacterioferritin-associated ferredoxin